MFKTNDGKVVLCEYVLKVQKMDIWSLGTIGLIILIFILAGAIGIIASIIKGAKRHKRMLNLLFFDEVTNGNNWLWFTYNGEKRLRKKKTASNKYAIVDILLIKYNNYCLCHSVDEGNQLLIKVNNALRKFVDKDEMVARKASADFVLLVNYDNEEELNKRITGLVSHLEHILDDHKLSFHAGIKPIEFRTDFEKEYSYARAARNTMESSDDSGVCLFDQKILDEQIWLENVTDRQEYAIKNEEFMVYYQPKYDPRTDELKGAEALIRWQSDKYGFVSPGRIIPIFEKNGFITEIDHYMIRHVARDQKKFKEAGLKIVPVSVNVSRAHFMENDLAEQIRDMVNDEGASPEYIEIELTESAFFDDKKAMIETISKLKEYGFSVSMDDFGSGYSSLNSLKDMPLDVLKLDAEFFRGDSSDERREIVVSEAIKLAKSLNMKTVAEGVEIKEQVDFLAKQGCDLIQGYYYAKPMPVSEYEERLEAHE